MNKLLRPKNWLLFIFLVILPVFIPETEQGEYLQIFYGLIIAFWLIKVSEELHYRLPKGMDMSLNFLQFNIVFSLLYLSSILLLTDGYNISSEKDNYSEYGWKLWIFIPCHIYLFFSLFHLIRFTAKSIASIENQKEVGISHYGTYMAALFFFPIGIWWTQPKINKILKTLVKEEEPGT